MRVPRRAGREGSGLFSPGPIAVTATALKPQRALPHPQLSEFTPLFLRFSSEPEHTASSWSTQQQKILISSMLGRHMQPVHLQRPPTKQPQLHPHHRPTITRSHPSARQAGPSSAVPSYADIDSQPLNRLVMGLFRRKMVAAIGSESQLSG